MESVLIEDDIPDKPATKPRSRSKSPRKKNLGPRANKLSQDQLITALLKKKECNSKAQNIVLDLIEPIKDELTFLEKLKDINQSHYDDIIDERSITKLCGYPLCDKELKNIPTKKYQISTLTNKVYDITERKKFCSSHCYKASMFIRDQMLSSPLWLRDQELIPEFKLLSLSEQI
ncbi:RPAP2 family protein [Megaselia abdita]